MTMQLCKIMTDMTVDSLLLFRAYLQMVVEPAIDDEEEDITLQAAISASLQTFTEGES